MLPSFPDSHVSGRSRKFSFFWRAEQQYMVPGRIEALLSAELATVKYSGYGIVHMSIDKLIP